MTFALIYSNWAFRSGCFEPSFALRLDWRENPSFTNSLRTVSALIGCPISVRAAASFSMLFDTQIKGRMGSPSVAGSTSRWSAGSSPGSFSQTARRPPPARRTCPFGNGSAPRSALPRLIVERASPVIFDTRARPPHPAVRTSTAANNRCPRSSSFEPTASQRCRMASSSIMRPIYACSSRTGIPKTRVTPPHDARLRFSYCSRRPKGEGEQDIDRDCNLGFDEANAAPLKIFGNNPHQLLGKKQELGANALGLQLPPEGLVFA